MYPQMFLSTVMMTAQEDISFRVSGGFLLLSNFFLGGRGIRVGSVSMNAWGLLLVELWFCLGFFWRGGASALLFWGWEFFKTFSLLATGPISLFLSYLPHQYTGSISLTVKQQMQQQQYCWDYSFYTSSG